MRAPISHFPRRGALVLSGRTSAGSLCDSRVASEPLDLLCRCRRESGCTPDVSGAGSLALALHAINGPWLNAKLADAKQTIAGTKAAAMGNVQTIAADAARSIVERLIGKAPDEKTVNSAVSSVIKG